MTEPTNAIGGETNGTSDVIALLRTYATAEQSHEDPAHVILERGVFGRLADMVERDYVRRDDFNKMRERHWKEHVYWHNEMHAVLDTLNGKERFWGACMEYPLDEYSLSPSEIAKQTLERNYVRRDAVEGHPEWIANLKCSEWMEKAHKLERETIEYDKAIDAVKNERDEWKAKAEGFTEALEKLGCSVLANGTVFGPTEAKSAKRAAAVERLAKLGEVGFYYEIIDALCDADCDDWSCDKVASTIRDLLTDDDGAERSVSNLEWLFEHDSDFAWKVDKLAWDAVGFSPSQPLEEIPWTHPKMRDWLMAPHADDSGKENDPETPDSAENPQKTPECMQKDNESGDCGQLSDMSENGGGCVRNDDLLSEVGVRATDVDANDANATQDSRVRKGLGYKDRPPHETTEETKRFAAELDAELDSREKLEADVRKYYSHTVSTLLFPPSANKTTDMLMSLPVDTVLGWLDRQEEITKGEWCTERGWWDSAEECTRVTAQCHEKDERIAELQAEIAKRDKGIARLKRQRDEARAERDMWRMRCGELLDAAHGIGCIADAWADE